MNDHRLTAFVFALTAAASFAAPASAAAGDPVDVEPGYPASTAARDVMPWLAAHTSTRPGDIVAITPEAVVILDGINRGADVAAPALAIVREEVIDPAIAARSGRVRARPGRSAGRTERAVVQGPARQLFHRGERPYGHRRADAQLPGADARARRRGPQDDDQRTRLLRRRRRRLPAAFRRRRLLQGRPRRPRGLPDPSLSPAPDYARVMTSN